MHQSNRIAEEQREDAIKNLKWEQMLNANMEAEDKAEDRRFLRRMQMEQKERDMEEAIIKVLKSFKSFSIYFHCIDHYDNDNIHSKYDWLNSLNSVIFIIHRPKEIGQSEKIKHNKKKLLQKNYHGYN